MHVRYTRALLGLPWILFIRPVYTVRISISVGWGAGTYLGSRAFRSSVARHTGGRYGEMRGRCDSARRSRIRFGYLRME